MREILDLSTPRRFDEGQAIFSEGLPADRFFLLLDGVVRVIRTTPNGDQIIALHIAAGQLFGIAPALGHTHYPATAQAAGECLVLCWPTRHWHDFITRYDGFADDVDKSLGKRFEELHNRLAEQATQAVEKRVANALLRLVNQTGRKVGDGIEIAFPITRANIADLTGTTLHTVSRLLSAWEKQGIVKSTRRHIVVTDPHQLVLLGGSGE